MSDFTIHSNGSKWAGETPNSLAQLLIMLDSEPLDPAFLRYGFRELYKGEAHYLGNFANLSNVFHVSCTPGGSADRLLQEAVTKNLLRPDFIAALTDPRLSLWEAVKEKQRQQDTGAKCN